VRVNGGWKLATLLVAVHVLAACGSTHDESQVSRDGGGGAGSGGALASGGALPATGGTFNLFVLVIRYQPGECLAVTLPVANGTPTCSLVEASTDPAEAECASIPGRALPDARWVAPLEDALRTRGACDGSQVACTDFHFCSIALADPSCLTPMPDASAVGWCYVSPAQSLGDPSMVSSCPSSEPRMLRIVDASGRTPRSGAVTALVCPG
jgi:hypothetical protein